MVWAALGGPVFVCTVAVGFIQYSTAGRHKVLRTLVADIVFFGPQIVPIGGNLSAAGMNGNQIALFATLSRFFCLHIDLTGKFRQLLVGCLFLIQGLLQQLGNIGEAE